MDSQKVREKRQTAERALGQRSLLEKPSGSYRSENSVVQQGHRKEYEIYHNRIMAQFPKQVFVIYFCGLKSWS